MSNVLAQSATDLAISNGSQPESWDFAASVRRAASRDCKNNLKESYNLKRAKVISMVCADFRAHFTALFPKVDGAGQPITVTQRVPEQFFTKIEEAVDEFISAQFERINRDTAVWTRRHVHKSSALQFVERMTITDERPITWKEQLFACHIQQGVVQRKLEDSEKSGKQTEESKAKYTKMLASLAATEENIKAHLNGAQQ